MSGKKFGRRMTSNMSGRYDPNPSTGYHGNQQHGNKIYPQLPTGNTNDSGRNPITDRYNGGSFGFGCHGDDCRDNFRGGDFSDTASDISMYTKSVGANNVEVIFVLFFENIILNAYFKKILLLLNC